MLGVEYYGFSDLTIALEVAYRHLFDYEEILQYLPHYLREDSVDCAAVALDGRMFVPSDAASRVYFLRLEKG